MNLREELYRYQDLDYKDFHKKLIPNIDEDLLIGVRVPMLRQIARQALAENAENELYYYEEKMVYGMTLGLKNCYLDEHKQDIKKFVPLIDNWAVCDCCASSFKFTAKNLDGMYDFILSYVGKGEYETRFAVVMLMNYYLVDEYIDRVIDVLTSIKSDYYYVNMAVAWALSFAFIKYESKVMPIIQSRTLRREVQNKTIQKIKESTRVSKVVKQGLNVYKYK